MIAVIALWVLYLLRRPSQTGVIAEMMVLGSLVWFAYIGGFFVKKFGQSRILGFLLAGFLLSPSLAQVGGWGEYVFSISTLHALEFLNSVALGLIAFMAGGEIHWKELKPFLNSLGIASIARITILPLVCVSGFYIYLILFPGIPEIVRAYIPVILVLLPVFLIPISPDLTIAVMQDLQARSSTALFALSFVILTDFIEMIVLAICLPFARTFVPGTTTTTSPLLTVLWEVSGSLIVGIVLGFLITAYLKWIRIYFEITLLFLAFVVIETARYVHLSGLLLCMTAGIVVVNFSDLGDELLRTLKKLSLPIFIFFFGLTGARIDIQQLYVAFIPGFYLFSLRVFGSYLTGRALQFRPRFFRNIERLPHLWKAFIAQGGLALGLTTLIREEVPEISSWFTGIIITMVTLNLLTGSFFLKSALTSQSPPEEND